MASPAYEVPTTARELATLVRLVTRHTRPLDDAEVLGALDFGYRKYLRAVQAVRPQILLSFVDPFTIVQGVAEYDIGVYFPPVVKPVRLYVPGSSSPVLVFRYKALTDSEYEARDAAGTGTLNFFYYDVLSGMLPGTPLQWSSADVSNPGVVIFTFAGVPDALLAATYPAGTQVTMATRGDQVAIDGSHLFEGFIGVVTVGSDQVPHQITVTPQPSNVTGDLVPMRRRVLRIAPTPPATYSGRLYYDYRVPHIRSMDDILDPDASESRDLIIHYALSLIGRAVNDAESDRWKASGDELRAELMQNLDPLAMQNTEAVGSAMPDD